MTINIPKVIGIIPARMGSSRFPNKPLFNIAGVSMIEHVYQRSLMSREIDKLFVATCDVEIFEHCESRGINVLMTSSTHTRALDRVAEAASLLVDEISSSNPLILNIQGDEPFVNAAIINKIISEFSDKSINAALLSVPIKTRKLFENSDTVKVVVTPSGDMAYSSRAMIPFQKNLDCLSSANRIAGLFAFRFHELLHFTSLPESPLEIIESCDINRMIDYGRKVKVSIVDIDNYYSVDSPSDLALVEPAMLSDELYKIYKNKEDLNEI